MYNTQISRLFSIYDIDFVHKSITGYTYTYIVTIVS